MFLIHPIVFSLFYLDLITTRFSYECIKVKPAMRPGGSIYDKSYLFGLFL